MANRTANVDNYNIAAIEQRMQRMSRATATKLGEPEKKTAAKPKETDKKKK